MFCMLQLKSIVGNIMNSTARKPIVGKFELRMFRRLPHVHRLSRHSSLSVNHAYLVNISVKLHLCIVRTNIVCTFPRKGLSTWCKTNLFFFFFNSRKIFPTKEMHSVTLIILHVKNWPQRSKRFNQLLKSKI